MDFIQVSMELYKISLVLIWVPIRRKNGHHFHWLQACLEFVVLKLRGKTVKKVALFALASVDNHLAPIPSLNGFAHEISWLKIWTETPETHILTRNIFQLVQKLNVMAWTFSEGALIHVRFHDRKCHWLSVKSVFIQHPKGFRFTDEIGQIWLPQMDKVCLRFTDELVVNRGLRFPAENGLQFTDVITDESTSDRTN